MLDMHDARTFRRFQKSAAMKAILLVTALFLSACTSTGTVTPQSVVGRTHHPPLSPNAAWIRNSVADVMDVSAVRPVGGKGRDPGPTRITACAAWCREKLARQTGHRYCRSART